MLNLINESRKHFDVFDELISQLNVGKFEISISEVSLSKFFNPVTPFTCSRDPRVYREHEQRWVTGERARLAPFQELINQHRNNLFSVLEVWHIVKGCAYIIRLKRPMQMMH